MPINKVFTLKRKEIVTQEPIEPQNPQTETPVDKQSKTGTSRKFNNSERARIIARRKRS